MTNSLNLTTPVWHALSRASRRALPREVGGLLLGYYTQKGPLVVAAPVVPDPRATRLRYRRDAATAARILDDHVSRDRDELTGYLGEWHSHPLPIGPSRTDITSIRALANAGMHDVVLLVVALGPAGWTGHARNVTPEGDVAPLPLSVEGEPPYDRREPPQTRVPG